MEKIFFNFGGVSVSDSRFVVYGKTYVINNVTSVKPGIIKPNHFFAMLCVSCGTLMIFQDGYFLFFGLFMLLAGILWYASQSTKYSVILHTTAGENQALSSEDDKYISEVIKALNLAIVSRNH